MLERQSSTRAQVVPWPTRGDTPINEFTTEGYISCAFPTLLPTGAADFVAPRQRPVTIGNYFKHLMMYGEGQFAKHPRFRYFSLNTEMRWRVLQSGRIFIKQHPQDARLSLSELRDMVGCEEEAFSSRVLHYAASLHGTSQYWFKQRRRLISMVDTLGLPTVFFTCSAADGQWPELAHLICPDQPHCSSSRMSAVTENQLSLIGFFIIGSASSSMYSTLASWEQQTTGSDLGGSTMEVLMCMVWPGLRMHPKLSSYSPPMRNQVHHELCGWHHKHHQSSNCS